jgi:hypothetical protein
MSLLANIEQVDSDEKPWTLLATEFTCVFPPGEEPNPSLVREIRTFDPNYVPLWLRKTYKDPQGVEVTFGWHCIGRWAPIADDDSREPLRLERPGRKSILFPFDGGVVYDQRTICDEWAEGTPERALMCPDIYIPFDQRLVTWMNAAHRRLMREEGTKQKTLDDIDARLAAEQKAVETLEDDARRNLKRDKNLIRRAIDEKRLAADPAPDPQPYVQADKVFEGAP